MCPCTVDAPGTFPIVRALGRCTAGPAKHERLTCRRPSRQCGAVAAAATAAWKRRQLSPCAAAGTQHPSAPVSCVCATLKEHSTCSSVWLMAL